MSNEEAITKLTNIMHDDHYAWSPAILTAFGMAVDALKGADGDCISRQAAIDAILAVTGNSSVRELYEHVQEHELSDMWSGGVNAAIDIIIAVPSAQPEQHWIPCSERLPAYGEDVLISIGGYCNVGHIVSVNEEEQYNWYFSGWYHLPNDVDAWMPLPEPYGGEAE